ncbi:MAG TPA: ABC transporter permease [Bryobacteraceae bacterium]|nr:ABC transporter permease [Bryobacteraceae bacterium]
MISLFRKLQWLTRRPSREADLQEELEFHLEEEAGEFEKRGLGTEQARRAARRGLGNLALVQEDTRAAWTWTWWEQLGQDLHYALRTMTANKTFTALAILSLALGIGANTAIFSFMDSILLRPLPVPDPHSLVILSWHTPRPEFHGSNRHDESYDDPRGGYVGGIFSYPAFELLQKNDAVFSSVFGYQSAGKVNLAFRGQADLADAEYVSGAYFTGLGTQPAAGRLLGPDDDRAGAPPIAVISYALSERRFGGPANAPGQKILLNNRPFTVAGVTQARFFGADPDMPPEIYVSLHANLAPESGQAFVPDMAFNEPSFDWVVIMARLRPGVSAAQAQAAAAGPFYEFGRAFRSDLKPAFKPDVKPNDIPTLVVREGAGGLDSLRRQYSRPLYILLALVGLILAIACANIANLLLARAAARRREIAVRLSMGAARSRVIRQLLTESVLLALMGGALGIAFAQWGIRLLTLLLANGRENYTLRAHLDWRVLCLAAALSMLTGVLFGLAPALQSTRVDPIASLKESRTGERRRRGPLSLSRLLVVAQIAVTLLIVIAAGLFARTLSNLARIELGFNPDNLLTFQLDASQAGHKEPEIVAFYNRLQREFAAIPGVRSVSLSHQLLIGMGTSATGIVQPGDKGSALLFVGAGFFHAMQIPILLGRDVEVRDRRGAPLVAIVDEEFSRQRFGGRNVLGQHLRMPKVYGNRDIEIIGVSANARYGDLKHKMRPTVYLPFAQGMWGPVGEMSYELRTAGNPLALVRAVRDIVHGADDRLPLADVKTQRAWIDETINQEIAFARLCGAFALLALAIACVGLYGSMSYNVARRTGEIGIRMALGAQRPRVVKMILRELFLLVALGLAISLPTALVVSKVVESFLFGMKPNDPLALSGAAVTLASAAILAGYLPARRASRIDPMTALRHE